MNYFHVRAFQSRYTSATEGQLVAAVPRSELVPSNKGGATVAYEEIDGNLHFAVAVCSDRDNFCRRIGRAVASGRLKLGVSFSVPNPGLASLRDIEQHLRKRINRYGVVDEE